MSSDMVCMSQRYAQAIWFELEYDDDTITWRSRFISQLLRSSTQSSMDTDLLRLSLSASVKFI